MKSASNLYRVRFLAILLVAMMTLLAGCGSSGGGGESSAGTGTVAVFVKDSPTDEFEHIWVTITQVELLPVSGSPVVIYENSPGCRIDILDHRNEDFLLKIRRDVPAGQYSKIRLRVTSIELVPTATSTIGSDIAPAGCVSARGAGYSVVIGSCGGHVWRSIEWAGQSKRGDCALEGFRSRWKMPRPWECARALASCAPMWTTPST